MRSRPTAIETNGTASDYDICHTNQSTNCSAVPSYNEANSFYNSKEYQEAHEILKGHAIRHHQTIEGT